jgi:hypothetical protein
MEGDATGSRRGNVRDIDAAHSLSEQDMRRTLIVREAIRRVFLEKGELHADDLANLGIPAEHLPAIIDEQIARLANAKLVTAEGDVYKPTELGQRKLDALAGVEVKHA